MRLDSVGTEIYDIHEYFRGLTVGQRTLGFWGGIESVSNFHSTNTLTSLYSLD